MLVVVMTIDSAVLPKPKAHFMRQLMGGGAVVGSVAMLILALAQGAAKNTGTGSGSGSDRARLLCTSVHFTSRRALARASLRWARRGAVCSCKRKLYSAAIMPPGPPTLKARITTA